MRRSDFIPNHGHSRAECDALNASDAADRATLSAKGLTLYVSTDFAMLKAVNAQLNCVGYGPLMPIYDVDHEGIDEHNGFWICVQRGEEPVAIMGGRLREVVDFTGALSNNTFLMGANPPTGASTISDLAGTDGWRGRIVYIGSLWVHPKQQGAYLSRMLVNAVVRLAWYRWTPRHVVAIVGQDHWKLARRVYGFRSGHGEIRFKDPRWEAPVRCELFSISQDEVRERILGLGAR